MHGTTGFHSHGTGARAGMIGGGFRDRGHDFGRHRFHHHFNDFVFFDFGFPFYPYPFYYPGSYYPYSYYGYDPYVYYAPPQYQGHGAYQGYGGYGVRGSVVIEVQRRLAGSGYYRGPIDGVIGSGTGRAIRAYQRSHGLRADGVLSRRFLATMGLA